MKVLPLLRSATGALRQARAWGWPFALGFVGLAVAGLVLLILVPQMRRETQALALEADAAAQRALRSGTASRATPAAPAAPARFLAAFPTVEERQKRMAGLFELAVHHSLEVRRGEFQLSRDRPSALLRYSVTMPLTGTYVQLRGFVEDALASDVALSLDRLRLRRASAAAPVVEADLTWSFYMRPADAATANGPR